MFQADEQDNTPEEELNEVEIGNLPYKEFKLMIIKVFKELGGRLDEKNEKLEVFNKELKNIKKNQTVMKNIIIEMKSTIEESTVDKMIQRSRTASWKTE